MSELKKMKLSLPNEEDSLSPAPTALIKTDLSTDAHKIDTAAVVAPIAPAGYVYFAEEMPNFEFYGDEDSYFEAIRNLVAQTDESTVCSDEWCQKQTESDLAVIYRDLHGSYPALIPQSTMQIAEDVAIKTNRIKADMHSAAHMKPIYQLLKEIFQQCSTSQPRTALPNVLGREIAALHLFMHNWTYVSSNTGKETDIVICFGDLMVTTVSYVLLNINLEVLSDLELQSYDLALDLFDNLTTHEKGDVAEGFANLVDARKDERNKKLQTLADPEVGKSSNAVGLEAVKSAFDLFKKDHGKSKW